MKRSNFLGRWWLSIDKTILWSFIILSIIGTILIATASPAVASRIGTSPYYFIKNHLFYSGISFCLVFLLSCMDYKNIHLGAISGFIITTVALILVLKIGPEVKGARRWLHIYGISVQPSELIKPLFAITNAIILTFYEKRRFVISFILYALIAALLISEPDFGMSTLITAIWLGQIIIMGIPMIYLATALCITIAAASASYYALPHVQHRIDNFLNPSKGDNFQISKALSAFSNGGLIGVGPGEGTIKLTIPDSHSDFIFAVAAEEFGSLVCIAIIFLYLSIVIRTMVHMINIEENFIVTALMGLIIHLSSQAIINIGVNTHLLPTKGMTLPFISYGGSSTIANSLNVGMILSLTKTRFQPRLIQQQ